MMFAIGLAGQRPRILLVAADLAAATLSACEGEAVVPVDDIGDYIISSDGLSADVRVPSLAERRQELWSAAKVRRRRAEQAGCETPFGRVQTDIESRSLISTYAAGAPSSGWSIDFMLADNTEVTLDGDAVRTVNLAVMDHLGACHANAQRLRAEIDSAASTEALQAINIDAGWPAPGGAA